MDDLPFPKIINNKKVFKYIKIEENDILQPNDLFMYLGDIVYIDKYNGAGAIAGTYFQKSLDALRPHRPIFKSRIG